MRKKIIKRILFDAVRIAAVVLPLFLIFRQIDITKLGPAISQVTWFAIPSILTAVALMMFLQGFRWWLLIKAFTDKLSLLRSMAYHFSSAFYSLMIPNSLSQDIIRSVFATKQAGSVISWSASWIAKILGILVSLAFSVYGLILLSGKGLPENTIYILLSLSVFIVIAFTVSFSKKSSRILRKFLVPVIPKKFITWLEHFREGIYQYRNRKKWILLALMSSILMQLIFTAGVSVLLYCISGSFYFIECMAFMPLIEMISVAQPFTPNGIGVREALVALMFRQLGLTSEQLGIYIVISNLGYFLKLLGIIPILYGFNMKQQK